jgi:hypothetical protein
MILVPVAAVGNISTVVDEMHKAEEVSKSYALLYIYIAFL